MPINNEIQYKAALARYAYLDSLKSPDIISEIYLGELGSSIYKYEETHYPIEDTDATRSDT